MKKTNKGFSMVELIIVIAIMAILAGALAPTLIKYINKSRISSDVTTGDSIAGAVQTALTNEEIDDATSSFSATPYNSLTPTELTNELEKTLGAASSVAPKSTKSADRKTKFTDKNFYVELTDDGQVKVYACGTDEKNLVYPTQGEYFDINNAK